MKKTVNHSFKKYHFEFRHLFVLLLVLAIFQVTVSVIHKISLQNLLTKTQDWYQQDSAERLANLTATSLELLLENFSIGQQPGEDVEKEIIQAFNIILSQPLLQESVRDICVLLPTSDGILAVDSGQELYQIFYNNRIPKVNMGDTLHDKARKLYQQHEKEILSSERIFSIREGESTFHVLVPFVPRGEIVGMVYVKNQPDFAFITREVISSFDETALIFTALMLFGLLAMFYVSSYSVKERDEALEKYYQEREERLKEKIHYDKESLFTKRIYHTHHKAEKVMGFIKEDLRELNAENINDVKYRVSKYANFISRVIYDMKWFDPPIQAIRNPIFRTDLNEVIEFIVQHLFLRLSSRGEKFTFDLSLDPDLKPVQINEFVVWEILEPLIQNSIEHAGEDSVQIKIKTRLKDERTQYIFIEDDGPGIPMELMQKNESGIRKIFLENISTKENRQNAGYGCYLAYHIATTRCGWALDVENLSSGGCRFTISIPI
ncbi:MAG: hypothetical protein Kow0037_21900 [Calditrichia bacterium]